MAGATQVDFYLLGAADRRARLTTACRLAEKACDQGLRVAVRTASPSETAELDELMWTYSDRSFVPHAVWPAEPAVADHTPVLIASGALPDSHRAASPASATWSARTRTTSDAPGCAGAPTVMPVSRPPSTTCERGEDVNQPPDSIPVLTDIVEDETSAAPIDRTRLFLDELEAHLTIAIHEQADELVHNACREMEALLLEQVSIAHLRPLGGRRLVRPARRRTALLHHDPAAQRDGWKATARCGSRARTTPASPPRWWSSGS